MGSNLDVKPDVEHVEKSKAYCRRWISFHYSKPSEIATFKLPSAKLYF